MHLIVDIKPWSLFFSNLRLYFFFPLLNLSHLILNDNGVLLDVDFSSTVPTRMTANVNSWAGNWALNQNKSSSGFRTKEHRPRFSIFLSNLLGCLAICPFVLVFYIASITYSVFFRLKVREQTTLFFAKIMKGFNVKTMR